MGFRLQIYGRYSYMTSPYSEEGPGDIFHSDVYSGGFRSWGLGSTYHELYSYIASPLHTHHELYLYMASPLLSQEVSCMITFHDIWSLNPSI